MSNSSLYDGAFRAAQDKQQGSARAATEKIMPARNVIQGFESVRNGPDPDDLGHCDCELCNPTEPKWQRYALDARACSPEQIESSIAEITGRHDPSRPLVVFVITDDVKSFLNLRDASLDAKEPPPG